MAWKQSKVTIDISERYAMLKLLQLFNRVLVAASAYLSSESGWYLLPLQWSSDIISPAHERGVGPWVGYISSGCELYEAGEKALVWSEDVLGLVCFRFGWGGVFVRTENSQRCVKLMEFLAAGAAASTWLSLNIFNFTILWVMSYVTLSHVGNVIW